MAGRGTRDWDATTYDRVSTPQQDWARPVVDRLALRGVETVLDAGCGTGRVTAMLLGRLPAGRVIAVDGSAAMVAEARAFLDPARAVVVHSDLVELELEEQVDAVFSNAVFHWIADHERLFATLHATLLPGGRLEAQCGGAGNVAGFMAAVDEVVAERGFDELAGFDPTHFAAPAETAAILESVGFDHVTCGLEPRPIRPPEPREFVRSVCLGAHLALVPERRRDELVDAVTEHLGPDPVLDYVRLNISARRKAVPASS
jgi:trans-aconitate 2-methyltransferase